MFGVLGELGEEKGRSGVGQDVPRVLLPIFRARLSYPQDSNFGVFGATRFFRHMCPACPQVRPHHLVWLFRKRCDWFSSRNKEGHYPWKALVTDTLLVPIHICIYIYMCSPPPSVAIHEAFFWPDCQLHIWYFTGSFMPAKLTNVAIGLKWLKWEALWERVLISSKRTISRKKEVDCGKKFMLRRVRLSLKNKPIFSSSKELCIQYSTSYTAFFPQRWKEVLFK